MFRRQIREEISKIVGDNVAFGVERPENNEHGDYSSNVALVLAKKLGKSPREIAEDLKTQIVRSSVLDKLAEKVDIADPGFLNFWISKNAIMESLDRAVKDGENFGKSELLAGTKVIIEYTDPNPFKEFHIGHLMSNTIGESLSRIIDFNGAEVKRANYQGDVGLHVAKALGGLLDKWPELADIAKNMDKASKDDQERFGRLIFEAYSHGAKKYETDEDFRKFVNELNIKIYNRSDSRVNNLYDLGKKTSLEYFDGAYGIIGMKKLPNGKYFDFHFFESETGQKGKEIVEDGLKKNIFERSDGAIVFRGEKYGLHTRVFINSDGLPTYEAKELGLAAIKDEKYHADIFLVVTGNEIADYFRVVLEAEKLLFPDLAKKTRHIPHGMLRLPSGKMSSRTGDVITAEWLYKEVKSRLKPRFEDNERVSENKRGATLDEIALGAIKYSILRHSVGSDIVFDFEKSLSFEGDSGPYIQYTYVRAKSVLEKANSEGVSPDFSTAVQKTLSLERLILHFPDVVLSAYENLNPNVIGRYLLELSMEFNNFYEKQRILGVPESAYYVALTKAVSVTIKNGLNLLGIAAPEKM